MVNTSVDPLIGTVVSHYAIVAKLGGGGMGVVYKAIDTKLGRTVALKFLPPHSSHDEDAKQRFQREAQAASATNHRNICVIHDIEETNDGRLFIVMAHYAGPTLKQKLKDRPLPIVEALDIAFEVAEGLAKAHAQRIVHRDIKPGNLIVTDDGVKILDFGLAKFADALQLTLPGSTVGTTAYMSPEQVRGEDADERSDIWALGVVLYEMLTGRVPFKGKYPEATFHAIKYEPLPPLSAPGRDIPAPVEALVLRALEKEPARRYQTARELARDLGAITGRTVPIELRSVAISVPTTQTIAVVPWWRRVITPARVIVAAIALVAAAVGLYLWSVRPVVRIPVAIAPVANHTGEPELDDYRLALTETLLEELAASPNIRVVPFRRIVEIIRPFAARGDVSSREAIQAVAAQSGAPFVVMPVVEYRDKSWLVRAEVRSNETGTVAKTLETAGVTAPFAKDAVYRLMASLADRIQADFKAIGPGRSYLPRPASSRFRNLEAAQAFAHGLAEYERLEYSAAVAAFRRAAAEDDQHEILHAWIGRTLLMMFQTKAAIESGRRAKQLLTADTPPADAALVEAVAAESQMDFAAAEARYRERAALRSDDATTELDLAEFLKRQNQDQQAIAAYREVLRRDPGDVRPHVDLSQVYARIDEYPLADQEAKTALEKYRATGNRAGEAQALLAASELQRRQGNLAEARRDAEDAREIFEALNLDYGVSRVHQYLGIVAGYSGDYRAAVRSFEESLTRSRTVGNRRMEGVVLNNLAVAHERLGQRANALEYYQQSRDVYQDNNDVARAAEQEANVADLLIEYSVNQTDALRRLANARATFQKLGNVEFDIIAMEAEAGSALHAGRHQDARRQLLTAWNIAKDRQYENRSVSLRLKLAESYFSTAEYEEARKTLEEIATSSAGRDNAEVAVWLSRVYVRLGALSEAGARLERATAAIQGNGQLFLLPIVHLVSGELDYESGRTNEARNHFQRAGSLWTDELPDAASVEARCSQAAMDDLQGRRSAADEISRSIERASRMGRFQIEARCRLQLARVLFNQHQYQQTLAALAALPLEGDRNIGRELQAQIHYWKSLVLREQHDAAGTASEAKQALTLVQAVKAALPQPYQAGFAARKDIRPVLDVAAVTER